MEDLLRFLSGIMKKMIGYTVFKALLLEIYFGKNNIVGFCVSERVPNNKTMLLTNIYFYPSSNIVWLIVQELKTQQYLEPLEIFTIAKVCFLILYVFDNLLSKKKHLSKIELIRTFKSLERNFPNIKINLINLM